ncbi:MAG: alpha/beta hydrolase [Vicinamibacteria bacterium]
MFKLLFLSAVALIASSDTAVPPPGVLVDLNGTRLHIHCVGRGTPTVVVENGFDEYSTDWVMVEERVREFTRICTYDRAGYAWSDPGRMPRTFAQINLELREALRKIGEKGPFVLVGHSFGGPAVRNLAILYPHEVAGMVLADSVFENQRVTIQGKAVLLKESATGRAIPKPSLEKRMTKGVPTPETTNGVLPPIRPPADRLPLAAQRQHQWADSQGSRQAAAESERTWSPEYFARWAAEPERPTLGNIPLIVLNREKGGYGDGLGIPAQQLEDERVAGQERLKRLSTRGERRTLASGHDMQLEAPDEVAAAIKDVVLRVRAK